MANWDRMLLFGAKRNVSFCLPNNTLWNCIERNKSKAEFADLMVHKATVGDVNEICADLHPFNIQGRSSVGTNTVQEAGLANNLSLIHI